MNIPINILMIEDEAIFARAVSRHLARRSFDCTVAGTLQKAHAAMAVKRPDLILLDMRLPDGNGLDLLRDLSAGDNADIPVIVLTAFGDLDDAVSAMKLNACDYLKKPIDLEELALAIDRVLEAAHRDRQLAYSREREQHNAQTDELIGDSPGIRRIRAQIARVGSLAGAGQAPTVLILGETGTGKGLTARLLHENSVRAGKPFVHVDCTALPPDLAESELFGHKKGAFTSAVEDRTGLIEAAEDGTVFLDEIGELPPELQAKLLSVLERRLVRRVGSSRERPVQAWFIAATNRDLQAQIEAGRFRADLYYRLKVLNVELPPLRERGEDTEPLARHFLEATARRFGMPKPALEPATLDAMRTYAWPGNVRELAHLVERAVLLGGGESLGPGALFGEAAMAGGPPHEPGAAGGAPGKETLEQAEIRLIRAALARSRGNVSQAARDLGVTRMTLRYRMKQYEIPAKP